MRCLSINRVPDAAAILMLLEGRPGRFVLEDARAGTALVGAEPQYVLLARNEVSEWIAGGSREVLKGDLFEALRDRLGMFPVHDDVSDAPFAGGAVGYFSYDLGRSVERMPSIAIEDVPTPDIALGFYDSALWIDRAAGRCVAVSRSGDRDRLDFWRKLALAAPEAGDLGTSAVIPRTTCIGPAKSNFTHDQYIQAILKIQDYIARGDVYQVNLTQRFEEEISVPTARLFEALRRVNPAPNGCFIELGGLTLVSASPELFLEFDPVLRLVRTKPIKGTRPRGADPALDDELARELAESEKDRAENLMIVDMERNDLGRVATPGSVRVPKLWEIEAHPNVFQMVSTVEAELAAGYDVVDLLKSSFPGGSITGAPKVRAMEIIEELEPTRRGIYTGAAGYIDFSGRTNLNIVIRSFIVRGSKAYFHAGGGILTDSDPEAEYQETLDKISGLRAALWEAQKR